MKKRIFNLIVGGIILFSASVSAVTKNNWYDKSRYGLFVHYVAGLTIYPAGGSTSDINVMANNFNAKQLAADAQAFGMEYVIFTAWHAKMRPLYPSAVTEKWRPGNSSTRDCIRELINELKPRGIKLLLYVHSTDGFEFPAAELAATGWGDTTSTPRYLKWNNYVCELMAEVGNRYGTDLDGFWLDMTMSADYKNMIDKPRIREAMLAGNPNRVLVGNGSNLKDGMDYSSYEYYPSGAVSTWKGSTKQIAVLAGSKADRWKWWACTKQGSPGARLSAEEMYRFSVLQAAVNYDGGMAWAASPYMGGAWEDGVKEMFLGSAKYMSEVEGIKGCLPSSSYPTLTSKSVSTLNNGIAATKSADEKYEYIHVLVPPARDTLTLPAPADGRTFSEAVYLNTGNKVSLTQTAQSLRFILPTTDKWDTVNAVIRLTVSNYTAPGNYYIINNTDTTIKCTGTKWSVNSGRGKGDYRDDVMATTTNGEYFSYTFEGDGVEYIAPKGSSYGRVEIFIDGVSKGMVTQYASTYIAQQAIYSIKSLPYGTHTIKGVKIDNGYMQVDAIKVYQNNAPSAIRNASKKQNLTICPNPVGEKLFTRCDNPEEIRQVNIFNMQGGLMISSKENVSRGVDVSKLASGIYLSEFMLNDQVSEKRVFCKK